MVYTIRDEMTYNYLTRDEGFLGRETDSDHPTHGEVWSDLLHPRCIVVGRTKHPVQFRRCTMFAPPKRLTESFSKLGLKGFLKNHPNMYFLLWFYTPTLYHITWPWGWAIGHFFSFLTSYCDLPTFHPKKKKTDAGQPCVSKMVGIWFKLKRLPTNGSIVGISSTIISTNSRFFCFY